MDDQKRSNHTNSSSVSSTRTDFIVIAEFSEREGPISILSIPLEVPQEWNFNKSNFALRVLKSEFRKKKALGTLPSINVCDMQQFFEDDTNELYIYCHYTSIADFGARGYMRALCLTYITPTPKKIQTIFRKLQQKFTETAMILKKAAQHSFLREIDEIIEVIKNKEILSKSEYNDLFQCHLGTENRKNILIDMNEIRSLFDTQLLDKASYIDEHQQIVMLNRTRHRPHRVGKEGYKPLKELIQKEDYAKFRDSLRNIHSQFHKNCLDIYVDFKNKELSHLNPNRLFAIGSLSCLDIEPCHYLNIDCPRYSTNCNMNTLRNKQQIDREQKKVYPNLFLNNKHYNNKQFLQLYDRKMQQIHILHESQPHHNQHNDHAHHNIDNNVWENFIANRNKYDLEVQKEIKKPMAKETKKPKAKRRKEDKDNNNNNKNSNKSSNKRIEVRFRACSDRAREKNLYRCLLGRFRRFAEAILFTILTNRSLVILANNVSKNKEKVEKTVRALSLLIPGVENTNLTQEWRQEPLYCHQLPQLKIVGMSAQLCHKSPDNIWDFITIIQFDDCILRGPTYKCHDETKSFIHRMLHSRKRFKTPNLFYRYLSRIMLEMSLHVFLFYYISQTTHINVQNADAYYKALLETLNFTQPSDIDIAKSWIHIMQNQLYTLCHSKESNPPSNTNHQNHIRRQLLQKYGRRPPPAVRVT